MQFGCKWQLSLTHNFLDFPTCETMANDFKFPPASILMLATTVAFLIELVVDNINYFKDSIYNEICPAPGTVCMCLSLSPWAISPGILGGGPSIWLICYP